MEKELMAQQQKEKIDHSFTLETFTDTDTFKVLPDVNNLYIMSLCRH